MIPFISLALIVNAPDSMPLGIEMAVEIAVRDNPKLRAARLGSDAVRAQAQKDRPVARPTVSASATGTLQGPRITFPRRTAGDATVLPDQFGKLELNVEQPLYRSGLGAARDLYSARMQAAVWEARRAENDLILEVRKACFSLLEAESLRMVARESVDLARKHLDNTRLMLEAGTASERDVKASDADLAEAEQGLLKADSGVVAARGNLNRLLGRTLADHTTTVVTPALLPTVPDTADAGVARAIKDRPEIRELEENLRAIRAGGALASTQDKPALSARGTASSQTPSAFVKSEYFGASLVLTWNPFDAGKTRSDVQEAKIHAAQTEALLDDTRRGIQLDVEKAWQDMREASARLKAADRQVASAVASLEISELRFQARSAIQLEVSSSLLAVTRAKANRAQTGFALHGAAAEYAHAIAADLRESR